MIRDNRYLNPVLLIRELFFTNTEFEIILDDELLKKNTDNEKILYLDSILNYFKNFEVKIDNIFKEIYEDEYQLIPVDENLFRQYQNKYKGENALTNEEIEYSIKLEYFDIRKEKIRSFIESYVPPKIKLLNDPKIIYLKKEKVKDENLGFNYKIDEKKKDTIKDQRQEQNRVKLIRKKNLEKFCEYLEKYEFIEKIDTRIFSTYFNSQIKQNKTKIKWIGAEYLLASLIRELVSKNILRIAKNNYWDIIENVFINEDNKPINGQQLRSNHFIPKNIDSIKKLESIKKQSIKILDKD